MVDEQIDMWGLSSGFEDQNATIVDAYFGYNAKIERNGVQPLLLTLVLQIEGQSEQREQFYSTGSGWETRDGGKSAVREDGKPKQFNKNSAIGELIAAAIEAAGPDVLRKRGLPTDAAMWKGLSFRFSTIEREMTINGDKVTVRRYLPVEFLGAGGKKGSASGGSGGVDAKVEKKLTRIAEDVKDGGGSEDDFIEAALQEVEDGQVNNEQLVGIWAAVSA